VPEGKKKGVAALVKKKRSYAKKDKERGLLEGGWFMSLTGGESPRKPNYPNKRAGLFQERKGLFRPHSKGKDNRSW